MVVSRYGKWLLGGLGLLLIVWIGLGLWQGRVSGLEQAEQMVLVTESAGTPTPISPTTTPTPTSPPTILIPSTTPTATSTFTPTPTPTITPTTTPTLYPTSLPVARLCPDPIPPKPEYNHYWLAATPLPNPLPYPEDHFWLSHPVLNGQRIITSSILPYAFDGLGRYLLHNGLDFAEEPLGTPVLAVADGLVIVAQSDENELYGWRCNWYGQLVVVQLAQQWQGQPIYALYGHVLNIAVQPGMLVKKGQMLAEVGFGGVAALAHLHFELRVGKNSFDATRNPLLWLNPGEGRGVIAGRLVDPRGHAWEGQPVSVQGLAAGSSSATVWSYVDDPQHLIKRDEGFAENFVAGDLNAGSYLVSAWVQGELYQQTIEVDAGKVNFVELVTEAYKTPTPSATTP